MSEAKCEVSEEQRERTLELLRKWSGGREGLHILIAQALAQEAQRANERAEGLAKELADVRDHWQAERDARDAATARVAELEKQLADKEAEGQAELARLRALPDGLRMARVRLVNIADHLADCARVGRQAVTDSNVNCYSIMSDIAGRCAEEAQALRETEAALAATPLPSAQQIPAPADALAPDPAPQATPEGGK